MRSEHRAPVRDEDCVRFLQWALPRLNMRWIGFRKPRRQVCRRLARRLDALSLADLAAYRRHLEDHPDEWRVLDGLCRVTITRFRRDHSTWDRLIAEVLPELVRQARARGADRLRAWSCGCASGEEAATLSLCWHLGLGAPMALEVVGTDIDPVVLERAERGCYPSGALRELAEGWRAAAFEDRGEPPDRWCLRAPYRAPLSFHRGDVREGAPEGRFDLVLCRNLAFTYFDVPLQHRVLGRLVAALWPGGALVTGRSEQLPPGHGLDGWAPREGIYRAASRAPEAVQLPST